MFDYLYYQISLKAHGNILNLKWLPISSIMSSDDFLKHCCQINDFIDIYCTKILFIDGTDFNMKMNRSLVKDLQYIKEQDSLKWIFYTSSNRRLRRVIQKMEKEDIEITKYHSRSALKRVYDELIYNQGE
ncbi:MAG: hypothetical protein R2764_19100 [Bacteroidales bacterium]